MCGIFGILIGEGTKFPVGSLRSTVDQLFKLSESRGKEASGIAVKANNSIYVLKVPTSATKLIKSDDYDKIFSNILKNEIYDGSIKNPSAILGHSRLVTNGKSELNTNNQPVIRDGAVGIHNGIIVNDADLWKFYPDLKRMYDVDTEVFLSLLQMNRMGNGSIINAAKKTFSSIQGSASVAVLFNDANFALLATNTGSMYICSSIDSNMILFASEGYILKQLVRNKLLRDIFDTNEVSQVKAGIGYLFNLNNMESKSFGLNGSSPKETKGVPLLSPKLEIKEIFHSAANSIPTNNCCTVLSLETKESMIRTWERIYSGEANIKRCTKCIMPHTTPFIEFDGEGVCNYCRSYEARKKKGYNPVKGETALEEIVSKFRSESGEPDCLVGFSGGRDSAYGLDYIKNTLKLHPITLTYDWGMVVDLARRNQARICSKMGLEQILISADIKKKRENIRKNLEAWLKRPELGMVPILMAGDKKFYYYFHKVREQIGVKLFIFCGGHEYEETRFKYGFCGIRHGVDNVHNRLTDASFVSKLRLLWYYAKNFLLNPAYLNSSILATLEAYYCTYILNDDYLYLYHYIEWDEEKILSKIKKEFNWETSPDTIATWRIDDGTAAFYNYIYMTMSGMSEFDDFRSFQIRDGKLTREKAMAIVKEENKPRFDEIEWYAQAVGFDVNKAITIVNSASKLYN